MPSVEGNGAAVDFRGAVTKSEGVVWGQVVVALRDDDPIRRPRADTEDEASIFLSVDAGGPAAHPGSVNQRHVETPAKCIRLSTDTGVGR